MGNSAGLAQAARTPSCIPKPRKVSVVLDIVRGVGTTRGEGEGFSAP